VAQATSGQVAGITPPRTTPNEYASHPHPDGRKHIVVEAVADISYFIWCCAGLHHDAAEECRVRLFNTPAGRRRDEIDGEAQRPNRRFCIRRLVSGQT
jgi:hypothetical protein